MNIEIISIGDELLIGQVVNTNASWMAERFCSAGFKVVQISCVADEEEAILCALKQAAERASIIITTGGLGPTNDDITKCSLANYFEAKFVFNMTVYKHIEHFFKERGLEVTERNRMQAEVLDNCKVLFNEHGTAPGMLVNHQQKTYISLPGVPFEMKALIDDKVIPILKEHFTSQAIVQKTVLTTGIGESFLADRIKLWEEALPSNFSLAYLPSPGMVRLRLTARGTDENMIKKEYNAQLNALYGLIKEYVYGYDNDKLEEIVGKQLFRLKKSLSIAESCTGGLISKLITGVPGCSFYYKGGIIAYSNIIKQQILKVEEHLLINNGAVSEEVVKAMAEGVKRLYNTDYAVATSGIAGPDGGTHDKPVGTVWIAICSNKSVIAQKFNFGNHRERNIQRASLAALNMLRILIEKEN